jgi:hypothetical protein
MSKPNWPPLPDPETLAVFPKLLTFTTTFTFAWTGSYLVIFFFKSTHLYLNHSFSIENKLFPQIGA